MLERIARDLREFVRPFTTLPFASPERVEDVLREHIAILSALRKHDPEVAELKPAATASRGGQGIGTAGHEEDLRPLLEPPQRGDGRIAAYTIVRAPYHAPGYVRSGPCRSRLRRGDATSMLCVPSCTEGLVGPA